MIKKFALMICLVGFLAGCERPLKVNFDGKNPPTFRFDGSGELSWVFIYQVTPDGKVPPKGSEFWVIVPKSVITASVSPPITYGVVPNGFAQQVPANGNPPPLEEGKVYGFGAVTREAPGGDVWFTIRNGKSVTIPKTDPADPDMR
jgi:hypothetical protein